MFEVRNLSKNFGSRRVLKDVSFNVGSGELYGYVGGNGAGKTTSMRIMLGISEPDSGSVKLGGKIINDKIRSTIGYMPEERGLYPKMTLIEQLTFFAILHGYPRGVARKASEYWLDRLGLGDRLNTLLCDLSLGNQQRVQLAAAVVYQPTALILDEPFSGLDPLAVNTFSEILKEEAQRGIPVIFSSHQLDLVERLCDRIGILKDGEIIAEGSVGELSAKIGKQYVVRTSVRPEIWVDQIKRTKTGAVQNPIITVEEVDETAVRVKTIDEFDTRLLIDAVCNVGELEEFYSWRPSLHQIYKDKITDGKKEI